MQMKCVGVGNCTGVEGVVWHASFEVVGGQKQDRIEVYSAKPTTYQVNGVYDLTQTFVKVDSPAK